MSPADTTMPILAVMVKTNLVESAGAMDYPAMRCGNQVASSGNKIRITSRMRSVTTNGITPLKIVANDTSLTTLLITKTFIPTGGWIRPSSTVITMMTTTQIGPTPRRVITGQVIGKA